MESLAHFLDTKLQGFLAHMAQDPAHPPAERNGANYILASYSNHKNVYRLMAQVSALCNGQAVLHVSHNARSGAGDDSPVSRFAICLQALMADFRIRPTIADFEGHPIELYSALDPSIHRMVGGNNKFEFHRALLSMEKKANEHLAHLTQKYGYHFIFRIGLKEFYMTRVVGENAIFFRRDPNRPDNRAQIQHLCFEAYERQVHLSDAEKTVIIMITNCSAQDANAFWDWLEKHRKRYVAMQSCISLLNRVQSGNQSPRAAN